MDTNPDQPLRLLLLEDNEADAELLIAHLEAQGIHTQAVWVSCRSEYCEALATSRFDLICSDYSIPGFDGLSALEMAQSRCPGVPFIFVSGKLGEEFAIGTLRDGATDYVLKRRLSRLAPAVRRAVAEAEEKRAHAKAQSEVLRQKKLIDEALHIGGFGVWHWNLETGRVWASAGLGEMVGMEPGDIAAERVLHLKQIVEPEDRDILESTVRQALATGIRQTVEFRVTVAAGQRTLTATFQDSRGPDGRPREILGTLEYTSADRQLRSRVVEWEDTFKWMLSCTPIPVVVTNEKGLVLTANPGFLERAGKQLADVEGVPVTAWLNPAPQDGELASAFTTAGGRCLPCKTTTRSLTLGEHGRVKVIVCIPPQSSSPFPVLQNNLDQAAAEIFNLANAIHAASEDGDFQSESKLAELRRRMASLKVLCQLFDLPGESRQSTDLNVIVEAAVAVLERSHLNIVIVPLLSQQALPIEVNAGAILQFLCQTAHKSAQQVGSRGSMVIQTCPIQEDGTPGRALLSIEIRGSSIAADQLREPLAGCGGNSEIIANPPLGSTVRVTWPVYRSADVPSALATVQ
jgi:CheY-like chemotaxis protein